MTSSSKPLPVSWPFITSTTTASVSTRRSAFSSVRTIAAIQTDVATKAATAFAKMDLAGKGFKLSSSQPIIF